MSVVSEGARSESAKGLGPWLARIAPRSARGAVTIAILPDSKVRALNRTYRGVDAATDVLSFAASPTDLLHAPAGPKDPPYVQRPGRVHASSVRRPGLALQTRHPWLGDIAIARGIAQKQAKLLGHSLRIEFRVLALHGLLHLLGYDHESDSGRMARVEARLRRKAGLPLGLIARSS